MKIAGNLQCPTMQELAGGLALSELSQQLPASTVEHPRQLVEALVQHQVPGHRAIWLMHTVLELQQGYAEF